MGPRRARRDLNGGAGSGGTAGGAERAGRAATRLDHVVIVVPALADAMSLMRGAGFTVLAGGRHDAIPTENALVCFADGSYLELLAMRDPAAREELRALAAGGGWERHLRGVSAVARRFLPDLAGPDGVADWVLEGGALAGRAARLRALGIAASGPVRMSRARPDGEDVEWDLVLPGPALHPIWIADRTPRSARVPCVPASVTHANGACGVRVVRVGAAVVPTAALELGEGLGEPPRLLPGGGSALELAGARVELVERERTGACAVTLAGCGTLPAVLAAWGVLPEAP